VRHSFWRRLVQPQDLVWLLLFASLAALSPRQGAAEAELLALLAVLQVVAPRIPAAASPRGNLVLILLKLLLGFLLIGVTGGILSSYALILLLPVLSAATTLGARGTAVVTALACAADLAFLPWAWHLGYQVDPDLLRELVLRVLFLPVVAFLTYGLAESNRMETRKAQRTAQELAGANEKLSQAEASARRAERLAALGQLSAGLAHELRNPLGTMKASSEMLNERLKSADPVAAELAGYISSEVDRTNSLVSRFLEFARPLTIHPVAVDIHAVADQAAGHLQNENPTQPLALHRNYDPTIPSVQGDPELLERLIFNLLKNAFQASPEGALVTIKTKSLPGAVELAVLDRGPGIAPEHREQIFNPFFTTRPTGTGLGLAICSKIAAEHGAALTVESEVGRGTTFSLRLPVDAAESKS
jgi:signal transduction histidine kinase